MGCPCSSAEVERAQMQGVGFLAFWTVSASSLQNVRREETRAGGRSKDVASLSLLSFLPVVQGPQNKSLSCLYSFSFCNHLAFHTVLIVFLPYGLFRTVLSSSKLKRCITPANLNVSFSHLHGLLLPYGLSKNKGGARMPASLEGKHFPPSPCELSLLRRLCGVVGLRKRGGQSPVHENCVFCTFSQLALWWFFSPSFDF